MVFIACSTAPLSNASGCARKRRPCTTILTGEVLCITGRERELFDCVMRLSGSIDSFVTTGVDILTTDVFLQFYKSGLLVKRYSVHILLLFFFAVRANFNILKTPARYSRHVMVGRCRCRCRIKTSVCVQVKRSYELRCIGVQFPAQE